MKSHSLLFFIKQLTTHRKAFMMGVLFSIVLAFSSIALLSLSGWFISAAAFAGLGIATASAFNYFIPASIVRFLALIRILSRYADRVVNHDYTFKILTQLRVWFYEKLIPLSPARLLTERTGDLLNKMVNDIDTLDHLYLNLLSPFFISFFIIAGTTFFIAHFSKILSLENLMIVLFFIILISWLALKSAVSVGKKIQETQAKLRIKIVESVQGLVDLLLFEKKENRLAWLDQEQRNLSMHQKKFSRLKGFIISAMLLASGISIFIALYIGIPLINHHVLNGAILAMIIFLIIALYEQLMSLPMACLALGKTKEAANRVLSIALQKPAVIFRETSEIIHDGAISFQNITFHYPDRSKPVIEDFSLDIKPKTQWGIAGPSGVGKTTLLNLLARIFDPISGDIVIGDTNLKNISEKNLRESICYVAQQVHIFNASVRDNITLFQKNVDDAVIWHWLEKMDLADDIDRLPDQLNTFMGEFGKNFSGGQIRRIAIARALLADTPILLLDEPSTGLDDALTHRLWKNCENDFKNKTVVVATHDPILLEKMDYTVEYPICSINPAPIGWHDCLSSVHNDTVAAPS